MYTNLVFFLILAAVAVSHADKGPVIKISAPENRVKPGDDVTIQCVVDDYKPGMLVFWKKRQGTDDEIFQLGTNTLLEDQFANTGRYSIDVQEGKDQMIFLLNIKGAVAEDSGELGCEVPNRGSGLVVQSLTVISPVEKLTLYGMKNNVTTGSPVITYTEGEEVAFAEGEDYFFRCVAEGSNPVPELAMSVAEEDISDKFTPASTSQVGTEGAGGLRRISTTALTTTNSALTVTHEQNGLDLRCTANLPDSEPISTSIKFLLHFPPTIRRCGNIVRVPKNRAFVHIVCIVKAHPAVYMDSLSWHFYRKDKSNITLYDGDKWGHYHVEVHPGKLPDEHEVHLAIERVGLPYFKSYYLNANNEMGSIEHKVDLQRDTAAESKSGADSLTTSVTVLVIAGVLSLLRRV